MSQQRSAFDRMDWKDTIMVPSGDILPGDILDNGGELVLGWRDEGKHHEKLAVLTPSGQLELRGYGRHFNMCRLRREGER